MDVLTNDLIIENGDMSLVEGDDAIAQDLQQTLQTWFGEWFLDIFFGIPYRQRILVKNPNIDDIQALILNAAQSVPGIAQILDFSFNYDPKARTLDVTVIAQTSTGQTIQAQTTINPPIAGTIEGTPYP